MKTQSSNNQNDSNGLLSRLAEDARLRFGALLLAGSAGLGSANAVIGGEEAKIQATSTLDPDEGSVEAVTPERASIKLSRDLMTSKATEGVIIEGNTVFTTFIHGDGNQHKVFVDTKLKQAFPGEIPDGQPLNKYKFYLSPNASLDVDVLRKAFKEKKIIGDSSTGPIYEMNVPLQLIDDDLRSNAAKAINEQFNGANVSAANILIAPFRYIEIFASVGTSSTLVASWPAPLGGGSKIDVPSSQPSRLPLKIRGDESSLAKLRDEGRLDIRFFLSGFTVKQNVLSLGMKTIVQSAYMNLLTGDAKWEDRFKIQSASAGGSLNLGFLTGGASGAEANATVTRNSLVTRNQVKEVSRLSITGAHVGMWLEFEDTGSHLASLRDIVSERLTERMREIDIAVSTDGKLILGEELKADIAPDVVTKIEQELKDKTELKNTKTDTVKKGDESTTSTSTFNFLNDDDVQWNTGGKTIIPKSVRLFQVGKADFADYLTFNATIAEAHDGGQNFLQNGYVFEIIREAGVARSTGWKRLDFDLNLSSVPHANIGDGDLDGGKVEYSFTTGAPEIDSEGKRVKIPYYYKVYEVEPDNTTLEKRDHIYITVPDGLRAIDVRGGTPINFNKTHDEYHGWTEVARATGSKARVGAGGAFTLEAIVEFAGPLGIVGGPITEPWPAFDELKVRGDGPGDNDSSYARADGRGHIEILVETSPAKDGSVTYRDLNR